MVVPVCDNAQPPLISVWDETRSFASTLQLLGLNISTGRKEEGHVTRDETRCVTHIAQITWDKKGGNRKRKESEKQAHSQQTEKGINLKDVDFTRDVG